MLAAWTCSPSPRSPAPVSRWQAWKGARSWPRFTHVHSYAMPRLSGCDRLEAFGSLCAHKSDPFAPLAALTTLRRLDFSRCALEELPPHLGGLPQLRTLLLAGNQLATLPPPADPAAVAEAAAAAAARVAAVARGGAAGGRAAAAGSAAPLVALPPDLEHLDLRGNAFKALPAALVAPAVAAHLTHLDLSGCWGLSLAASDWRRLIAALPRLRTLRHRWAGRQGGMGQAGGALQCGTLVLARVPASACRWAAPHQHPLPLA